MLMFKELWGWFYRTWLIGIVFFTLMISTAVLYYPFHVWIYEGVWRWETIDRTVKAYVATVPVGFVTALILTFNRWLELRKGNKKSVGEQ